MFSYAFKHCSQCNPLCSECSSISKCTKCTDESEPVNQTFLNTKTADYLCSKGYSWTAIWLVVALLVSCVPSIGLFCVFLGPRRSITTKLVSESAHNQNYVNVANLMQQQRAGGFAREAHNPNGYAPQMQHYQQQGQMAMPGQMQP